MSGSEYVGPLVMVNPSDEVTWQFGVRRPDGWVTRMARGVNPGDGVLVQRRLVPIEDWKEVAQGDLA